MDVVAWLRELGLERYAPAFRENSDVRAGLLDVLGILAGSNTIHAPATICRFLGVALIIASSPFIAAVAFLRRGTACERTADRFPVKLRSSRAAVYGQQPAILELSML